jgi:hypothetical protein
MQYSQTLLRLPAGRGSGGGVKTAVTSCDRTEATFTMRRAEKSRSDAVPPAMNVLVNLKRYFMERNCGVETILACVNL